ncbi:OmpA family protein [Bacteroides sp. UBA939]|uniref:OmpA family protein n=1 Tax=Bacteroides sp. UBA939 TaxID=1946092 RepID=UPI0025BE3018|nr:OmpA family protein [Bacteroides sp. UBA939]
MKRVVLILVALLLVAGTTDVQAQWLKKLGQKAIDRAEERAKKKVEDKVDKAVDKTVDDAFEGAEDAVKGKDDAAEERKEKDKPETQAKEVKEETVAKTTAEAPVPTADISWNKFDFVAGDEVMFEDNLVGEANGEFPSQWDLLGGNAEISKINGENVIYMDKQTTIAPLMKNPKNYLPESYTIEFDFYISKDSKGWWKIELMGEDGYRKSNIELYSQADARRTIEGSWETINRDSRSSSSQVDLSAIGWHRVSISFNKRALKVYFDQVRAMNIPNVAQAGWFRFFSTDSHFLRNIRMAKGAVPLYDRMMSDGKFITYGITFDVGKSTIKPESMGEINRIVLLMNENPELKFSVEGHTDSTGNATSNQALSEARSKAIVDKLTELGISAGRLAAVGKGQTTPLADNGTDEGRAKNRRVEFVKQ